MFHVKIALDNDMINIRYFIIFHNNFKYNFILNTLKLKSILYSQNLYLNIINARVFVLTYTK